MDSLELQALKLRKRPAPNVYCGVTIILSNPSRFDTTQLFSGYAGTAFIQALAPLSVFACEVRVLWDKSPLLPNTSIVFVLGLGAVKAFLGSDYTVDEVRGHLFKREIEGKEVIVIASYLPQDACDMKNYEAQFNTHLKEDENETRMEGSEDDDDTDEVKSRHGKTKRKNYRFWLEQDCAKVARLYRTLVREKQPVDSLFAPQPEFVLYPETDHIIGLLNECSNTNIYLDIETTRSLQCLFCIGFSVDADPSGNVYSFPIHDHTGSLVYAVETTARFLRALVLAMSRNTVVVHNANFDLYYLAFFCGIPFGKFNYDTMLAHSRIIPGVEKSLGHCVSLYTNETYHKDEGNFSPRSQSQYMDLLTYNAKDVWTTKLVREGIDKRAVEIGAVESIKQVNEMIYVYNLMTLQGIRYDEARRAEIIHNNDRRMTQYLRVAQILTGGYPLLPTSPKSCVKYFHELLGLPIQARSKKTGAPSLDEKAFLKLAIKDNHPLIKLTLEYRQMAKESGSLKFTPYLKEETTIL